MGKVLSSICGSNLRSQIQPSRAIPEYNTSLYNPSVPEGMGAYSGKEHLDICIPIYCWLLPFS